MGMSSLVVVLGLIAEIHMIDLRIHALYKRKFGIAQSSKLIAQQQGRIARMKEHERGLFRCLTFKDVAMGKDPDTVQDKFHMPTRAQVIELLRKGAIQYDRDLSRHGDGIKAAFDAVAAIVDPAERERKYLEKVAEFIHVLAVNPIADVLNPTDGRVIVMTPGDGGNFYVQAGAGKAARVSHAHEAKEVAPGEIWLTKEQMDEMVKVYLAEVKVIEIEIDQELEVLKAQRTALVSQKDEFIKYTAEGIKNGFKNNYA